MIVEGGIAGNVNHAIKQRGRPGLYRLSDNPRLEPSHSEREMLKYRNFPSRTLFLSLGKFLHRKRTASGPVEDSAADQFHKLCSSLLSQADAARDKKSWAQAAHLYGEVVKLSPDRGDVWVQLGNMSKEALNFGCSKQAYYRALALSSDEADTHLQLGHLLKLTGDILGARNSYENAQRLDAQNIHAAKELQTLAMNGHGRSAYEGNLEALLTPPDIDTLFQVILRRSQGDQKVEDDLLEKKIRVRDFIGNLLDSDEYLLLMRKEYERRTHAALLDPLFLRAPQNLVVAPSRINRILIVGSCFSEIWAETLCLMDPPCACDLYMFNGGLPDQPEHPISDYDFQMVQLPLRAILPDAAFARLGQDDVAGHQTLFAHAVATMRILLDDGMRWNRKYGILTFVFPVIAPLQNAVGRLLPRYDLRNPVYFIEKLNEEIASQLQHHPNAYFFDFNEVIATHGRRYIQEDMVAAFNHGSVLLNFDSEFDGDRLEEPGKATDFFEEQMRPIFKAAYHELIATYRTVRQVDTVKLVVIDLDDTLWRGVAAEVGVDAMPTTEGWPKGFWEALAILKRRGVLLAIISKNDEGRIREIWQQVLGKHLSLDDFAIVRINWRPKSDNMAEILAQVNLLPRNVVFIDDNPAQRQEVVAAFPEIRVLGGSPLLWRHVLLWSAELQTSDVTAESAARTKMVQAQVAREASRHDVSRADFLASLDVRMNFFEVDGPTHPRFSRVVELINKTNQFNTTGRRWAREEITIGLTASLKIYAFEVADVFTEYGLVGVLLVDARGIVQFVMSCRVMGLEAEIAAVAHIAEMFQSRGAERVFAAMTETDRNLPCRDVYKRCGFQHIDGGYQLARFSRSVMPAHITVTSSMAGRETAQIA